MTNEEYKKISEALYELQDKLVLSIDKHTKETLQIISNQEQDNG